MIVTHTTQTMLSKRVKQLQEQSLTTKPYITSERAELLTDFYKSGTFDQHSVPVGRAMAFAYIMEFKTLCINKGELIVGERGPAPKATPTYPELCCHTLDDFDVMDTRERTPFSVSNKVREVYRKKVIPYWQNRTMRGRVFDAMNENWQTAFEAGVFTEFMEQRAPGHHIHDDKIYKLGLIGLKKQITQALAKLDYFNDPHAHDKAEELKAMEICCDAVIRFAQRHSELAENLASKETDPKRKEELLTIAATCKHVPKHPARTFAEALQSYWFIHLGVITELNVWDSFNPGRLDQHLQPFYKTELEKGSLTTDQATELLQCFWVKFNNQPAPPKVGITEQQSGTYQDFALINCGGLTAEGTDAVSEVSYLILDVAEQMKQIMPSCCIQLSKRNPDRFLKRACRVIKTGLGQPSVFNSDVIVKEFLHDGKNYEDARNGGPSGCVTIAAFGKEACTLTGYINWPKILELALNDGVDPRTGKQVGPHTGDAIQFSFEQLLGAYKTQLNYFIDVKIQGNNIIERLYATTLPSPFMSVLVDDCIKRGQDYHDGGPRYNPTYIQGVGIGTLTDMLASIRYNIFEKQNMTMAQLLEACNNNFDQNEPLRQQLIDAPKYGNDDDQADDLTEWSFNVYYELLDGRPNTKGGKYRVNLLPTTCHIYFGQVLNATPDGRRAFTPVSEGISPSQGCDVQGPTAVIKSAARIDHARTGGTLLNMKFTPQILDDDAGINAMGQLIRTYFRMDGHHIQFNVVTVDQLRQAQQEPEKHRNLIVRVAGYSDYFVDIGIDLQNEIIARTEHAAMG